MSPASLYCGKMPLPHSFFHLQPHSGTCENSRDFSEDDGKSYVACMQLLVREDREMSQKIWGSLGRKGGKPHHAPYPTEETHKKKNTP